MKNVNTMRCGFILRSIFTVIFFFCLASCQGKGKYWEEIPSNKQGIILRSCEFDETALSYYLGKMKPSDDKVTFSLLDELTKKNDKTKRAFYFYLFNKILSSSDGALSEVMGQYCIRFIKSDQSFVLSYLAKHPDLEKLYVSFIAYEIAGGYDPEGKSLKEELFKNSDNQNALLTFWYKVVDCANSIELPEDNYEYM